MAFSLVFTLLALSVVSYATELSASVPVYLWGDLAKTALKASPLYTVEPEEFSSIVKEELSKDPFTVIFIEETLSVEDFSSKNADGETSLPFLKANIRDSAYLPSVDNALGGLNQLADPEKVDHVKLTENGLSAEIEPKNGKFLFIYLKDAREGESRSDLLRRHNDFMEDMVSKLQERYSNGVVSIYTARFPSWTVTESHSRVRRQTNVTTSNDAIYVFDGLAMIVSKIELKEGSADPVELLAGTGSSSINQTEQNSTLTFGTNKVELHFTQNNGYWYLNTLTVTTETATETLQGHNEMYSLMGWSYRCGGNVTFSALNDTKQLSVNLINLRVQPYFESGNSSTYEFGDEFDCVGLFTGPILAGIFVVFLLLAIMFYGVMNMMDIRTMDRFDDPKGKTITINAAE